MSTKQILIVEDELLPATYLKKILIKLGYTIVGIARTTDDALKLTKEYAPDLILMDINLNEKKDGCDVALEIRQNYKTKIVFLTAHSDPHSIEKASRCNPNGYILKPYNINQIKVVLALESPIEHENNPQDNIIILIDDYSFHKDYCRLFYKNNSEVEVGPKALKLIELLASSPNISISNAQIIQEIYHKEVPIQTLRSLIHRIRQKTNTELIKNVNGLGYKLCSL